MTDLKYCTACGSKVEDPDQKFCKICGAKLERREVQESPTPKRKESEEESGVEKQPTYAGFGERLVAFLVDIIIISIISNIIIVSINFPRFLADPIVFFIDFQDVWFDSLINWGIGFLYFWLLEAYNQGQTLGKLAMNLRTVDEKTLEIAESGNYAINNLAKPSPFIVLDLIIGILINAGDSENRYRVLQNLSHTVVIKE